MKKVIWSCWLQGRARAPWLVERCLSSWQARNPDWEFRCLDEDSLARYVDLPELGPCRITRTSFSDILRVFLLRAHGGVWTDATVYCNRPLDEWLHARQSSGFFAFERPASDRMLSSWFLVSEAHHFIVDRWCESTIRYWAEHESAHTYFWFHELFRQLFDADPAFAAAWSAVPKLSAHGPHMIQRIGLFESDAEAVQSRVDWQCPMFKLTYRIDESRCVDGTLLARLLGSAPPAQGPGRPLTDHLDVGWRLGRSVPERGSSPAQDAPA